MGAVFRRPVWSVTPEELGDLLRRSGIPLYGAALRPDAMDARQADYSRCALAIGSEGRGLSREVLDLCDKTVLIPMSPPLRVAERGHCSGGAAVGKLAVNGRRGLPWRR